ncbi:MAG: hypothetical protein Fur0010_16770 [Bdellovibrio sp.]
MNKWICSLLVSLFLFSVTANARVVVISDFDDTLKQANSAGRIDRKLYHFFRKKVYEHSRDLFVELKDYYEFMGENVDFFYVSAAPDAVFNQEKWIEKHGFPMGETFLRKPGDGKTYDFKFKTIERILKKYIDKNERLVVFMFGDNSEADHDVYNDLTKKYGLKSFIFIRDVKGTASGFEDLPMQRLEGINYFFSEREFESIPVLSFLSPNWHAYTELDYLNRTIVPKYTLVTLKTAYRKLEGCKFLSFSCRRDARARAEDAWEEYHTRY